MTLNKEQLNYIKELLDEKHRKSQPLERLFIEDINKELEKLEQTNK